MGSSRQETSTRCQTKKSGWSRAHGKPKKAGGASAACIPEEELGQEVSLHWGDATRSRRTKTSTKRWLRFRADIDLHVTLVDIMQRSFRARDVSVTVEAQGR